MFNHTSYLEISESAYENNLNFIRKMLGPETEFSSVVKGNAYGHGIEPFVKMAYNAGVRHFSVFSGDEAYRVYSILNNQVDIMVMGWLDNHQIGWAVEHGIEFFIYELDRLEAAISAAKKAGKPAKVHIELETGMNRTGFSKNELKGLVKCWNAGLKHLQLYGVCTHYAGAESIANYHRIKTQQRNYKRLCFKLEESGLYPKKKHTACSAASLRYPTTKMDLARIGILQYGYFPSRETMTYYHTKQKKFTNPLQRLISWKSQVMDVKQVKTGEFVGYGTSYLANNDMYVATVPVGYSHGFSRGLSNQGRVLIHGKRTGVVGTVNMNMMTVDVSHIKGQVQIGDEVVLIGRQGELEISVASFSDFSDQVNYELLTRLPRDIPRKVIH